MTLFLTSNIGGVKKENGEVGVTSFTQENGFIFRLKDSIRNYNKFVLIASNKDNYEKNDFMLKVDIGALNLSKIFFHEYVVLDSRNKDKISEVLKGADLIMLCGGNTLLQNNFFNEVQLKDYLPSETVIVGISAGSINSAHDVYDSPECEEDLNRSPYLKGLGITNINVEPHFILEPIEENDKLQRREVLKESFNRDIIALTDGAYIIQTDEECTLYGEGYLIKEGLITKLCENDKQLNIYKEIVK